MKKKKQLQSRESEAKFSPPPLSVVIADNVRFAASRASLYLLPILESANDTVVNGTATKITDVELVVSPSADIDSDDDDDDEVDEALRKFTLQTVLYIARPPMHFKHKAREKSLFDIDSADELDEEASPEAVSRIEILTSDPKHFSSKTPLFLLTDAARLQRVHNQLAASEILLTAQQNEIQRKAYTAVLSDNTLHVFHSGRSLLALNISCSVSRIAFYNARNSMSAHVQQEEQARRRKQNRESLFFIDSDDSDEDEDDPLSSQVIDGMFAGSKAAGSDAKDDGALPLSEGPPNFPVKRWVVRLVCYDG